MKLISTDLAPAAVGPYSQGVTQNNMVFTSGQLPINPSEGKITAQTIEEMTLQSLTNCKAVIEAAGGNLENVVKTTIFLKDMNTFVKVNGVYAAFFKDHKPARSTIEVARLPMDAQIEIEMVAIL